MQDNDNLKDVEKNMQAFPEGEKTEHECCCGGGKKQAHGAEGDKCGCSGGAKENAEKKCACEDKADEVSPLLAKLDEALKAAEKNRDLYIRSVADLDTYRRKAQREKEELLKFAVSPFIEDLLPSLDTIDIAIAGLRKDAATADYAHGVEMLGRQIKKVFENYGVKEINPLGEDFDPKFHECIAHQTSAEYLENKVMSVMRTGFSLNGRLIRPAGVIVSKGAE